ncbi:hypothetical protein ABS798_04055, partial [Mycoplasmopsis bovis]
LSETLKSITGNDLGKVQVAEQDKSNKEKIEAAIKEAIVAKVPTLKDKELKLNADLSKKSVTVSAKDFEGEVTLKFEIEAKSDEEMNPGNNMTPGSNSENGNNQNTPIKKSLPAIISNSNQQLGKIKNKDKQSILEALLAKNRSLNLDKSQLDVENIKDASAIVFAKGDSTKYEGKILVSFTINSPSSKNPGATTPGGSGSSSSKNPGAATPGGSGA